MKDISSKHTLGREGEKIACEHLEKQGHKLLCRNYKVRGGEIDIITLDGDTLVFSEVKTRSGKKCGNAAEAVDSKKISRMCVAAERYIYEQNLNNKAVRFDVIEVYAASQKMLVNHIKGIDIN